jgi:hypothetical protein
MTAQEAYSPILDLRRERRCTDRAVQLQLRPATQQAVAGVASGWKTVTNASIRAAARTAAIQVGAGAVSTLDGTIRP